MFEQPTPEDHINQLTDWFVEKGVVSSKGKVATCKTIAHLRQMQEKYFPIFLKEGFTQQQAEEKLDKHFSDFIKIIQSYNIEFTTQEDLEKLIINTIDPALTSIVPSKAISLLPAIIEIVPFELNIHDWIMAAVKQEGNWERTKPALRYLDLWKNELSKNEQEHVFGRLLETDEGIAGHPLALYLDKIVSEFSDRPDLIAYLTGFITGSKSLLPAVSNLPISEMPERFKLDVDKWIDLSSGVWETDKIKSVKSVDYFAGTCGWMSQAHYETFVDKNQNPDVYGWATLIYVDNNLVGSMKLYRNKSILGLINVKDSKGRLPVVTGGIYSTTKEITELAKEAHKKQGNFTRLDLDEISMFPMEFMGFENDHKYQRRLNFEINEAVERKDYLKK
ncbi:hypothetical protein HOK51_08170 [Candidatus Woesearchaeota archaeon]|jgi:hypothetical protein|nr:hypothetical protein [Candidatus Woesearchaeota archaeon]MBT6519800.1 hypothetical protein [Candidatus Woesearchaeota archaeon]MBT7368179.1 hypothetical protein [Candidatus Woesearchaeota archaeon]